MNLARKQKGCFIRHRTVFFILFFRYYKRKMLSLYNSFDCISSIKPEKNILAWQE